MTSWRFRLSRRGADRWRPLFLLLMSLVTASFTGVAAGESPATSAPGEAPFQVAATGDHLWFITTEERDGTTRVWLAHHARAMAGPFFRPILPLVRRPDYLAAWGDRLWLAFDMPGRDPELFTSGVQLDPIGGQYKADPAKQLDPVRALPAGTRIEALGAGANGPWIIGVGDDGRRLGLALTGGLWVPFDGPPVQPHQNDRVTAVTTGMGPPGSGNHVILIEGPDRPPWLGRGGDLWQEIPLPAATYGEFRRLGLIRVGTSVVLVTTSRTSVHLDLIRPSGLARAFSWPIPADAADGENVEWVICGMGDVARQMSRTDQDAVIWRDVDLWAGTVGVATALELQPIDRLAILRGPMLLAVAILVLVLLSVLRNRVRETAQLPADFVLASIPRRLLAQIVDLLPGAIVACVVLDVTAVELIKAPLYVGSGTTTLAWIMTVAVGGIIATLTEMMTGTSAGKRIFGLEILGDDNKGLTPRRIALRGLVRGLVLLLPILAVMVMGTPGRQGLHDLAGGTLVGAVKGRE